MKSSPARIAAVTAGLLVAGALFGSVAAVIGSTIAVTITELGLPPWELVALAAIIGGVLGAPLLPVTSWLLLRRVPLGLSFVGTTVGTTLGGVIGWIAAMKAGGNPVGWPVMGAVTGFFAAVLVLRMRFSSAREVAQPASRVAV